jgi:hypothetical protein
MGLFQRLFHHHDWKIVSKDISGSYLYIRASRTLECRECGVRKYQERGVTNWYQCFHTKSAAEVWLDSITPIEAREE